MQSLYGSWEQWCFVRVDVSRAVHLWECPLAEHPLYFRLPKCKFEKKSSQVHCLWVMCSVSTPLLKKIKFIPPKKIPWVRALLLPVTCFPEYQCRVIRLIYQQQHGNVIWRWESTQQRLNASSGAQFVALPLVEPVVWFALAVINWRSDSVAKAAYYYM